MEAKSKAKQLERDYDDLKRQFQAVRSENEALASEREALVAHNKKLQSELVETIESFQRSSRVGDSPVYGRENEKNSIIEFLLADDFNRNNLTVVCIVGESGIGKTSIVQLIYSEERVLDSFDARMLITMPEKSDETSLINKLIESVTSSSCPMTEADLLEELLIDELSGTKFFVVLDDAENENPCFWSKIVSILNHSTRGSVLLVTTKSKDVAEVIGASQTYYLNPLPDYYCWKIFWQHIFTGLNTNANNDLVETGKQLVSKCQHNPLCIKVLAGLLVCLKNEKSWVEILKNDLWNMDGFDGDTLPALRVGYELLPNDLKKCLHYCSLFPKDYAFAKQQIVRMWMSQGFIISMEGRQPEDVGLQYFDELLLRGFFQHSPLHDVEDKFIMHGLIRALATNLSPKKGPPDEDAVERIFENCFHFALNPSKIEMDELKPLINSDLQSFLALTRFSLQTRINISILDITSLSDLFTKCINIRTLDLSCTDIVELPSSVGMLKQLRYLGVNNTKIRNIPRELCSLVNLQTLEAKDCQHLVELPETVMELKSLRHLDVSKKSGFVKMMIGIGQLTNLQSLAVFCVGCEMPYCSIRELKDLNCLSSCLQIAGLENVTNGLDAEEAALHNKVHLNTLWLHWNDNRTFTESEESVAISEEVLNNLKPNPKIGELIIRNYRGNLFPTWMGDPSFTKLVSIILDKCLNCSQFPALGGLPSLRHLSVQKLYHLVRLENTQSQFVSKNTPKFPSLETLNLWEMYDLEELFETSDHDFPCLRTLSISRCPMLKRVPCFSSLLNLSLYCCVNLPHLPDFPSLESLRIDGFQKIKSLELPKDLPALKELEIRHCNELLLVEGLPKLPSLKKLNVVHCPKSGSLKNWKPHHSKPISTTRWFFPKEESTTQMEHQETSEPAEDGSATVQHSTVNSGLLIQSTQLVGTPPNDGYTWRKYGQKSIKSSLSSHYYICTYPDCPAKKKVQWDDHDQISEIVCKGIHTHARSPNRCNPGYSSVPEVNNSSTMDGSISGLSFSKREREPSGEDTNDKQPKVHKSDLGLTRRSPRMQIEARTPSLYRLIFKCPPNLPIYVGTKIEDIEGNPLQILLVAGPNGSPMSLPSPIKIKLVVLDGDFPSDGTDDWTSEEFSKYVVKERAGKGPLLTGDVSNITMRDGEVSISKLMFTDNSSWMRSRNFRIAVRVVEGSYEGPRIREAMTDKFVVRDCRAQFYKKHYPPSLHDEVWRLEKIGKDGVFHRRLHANRIDSVQEFLQLFHVDPNLLREILGPGMSDKMWEITVNHARTCHAGEKKKVQWDDHDQISEIVCKGIHTHERSPNRCNPGYSSVPEVNNSSTMDGSISGLTVSKGEREPSGEDTNDKQPKVHKLDLGLTIRSPHMQIEARTPCLYRLIFKCPPNLLIYTGAKIKDIEGNPLQILLVAGPYGSPMSLPSPIKIELVVLDGDFPSDGTDDWTSEEFNKYVVKERAGKRPLLTGDVSNITMRDAKVSIGDLQFTDNSSWIRSRNFRIAVRVVEGSYEGPRIREAMTDKFVVRGHRGLLYRKHYPLSLNDEVWRLEKIAKNGAFHTKLHENRIDNVQDFLKLFHVDPNQLRRILAGMPDRMWEIAVNHARTCHAGEKIYSHSGPNATVFFNSICEILSITIDGMNYYSLQELPKSHKNYALQLVKEAYEQWGNLRETDGVPKSGPTQGIPVQLETHNSPTNRPNNRTGNAKTCQYPGCIKGARGASDKCIAHGGGRRCQKDGCGKGAEGRTIFCKAHGGGRRCEHLGCTKSVEGRTDLCIAHGGGRRCNHDGCARAARGRSGLCIRHGGGKRCTHPLCPKSAEGHTGLCIAHGGGRRCQFLQCNKGAQGSTNYCKAHGGGKRRQQGASGEKSAVDGASTTGNFASVAYSAKGTCDTLALPSISTTRSSDWIVDSGASHHVTGAARKFSSYTHLAVPESIRTADGTAQPVVGKGDLPREGDGQGTWD